MRPALCSIYALFLFATAMVASFSHEHVSQDGKMMVLNLALFLSAVVLVLTDRYTQKEMHNRWRTLLCKFIKFKVRCTDPALD